MAGHEDAVLSVAFDESGTHVVSGSSDGSLRLWDTTTGLAVGVPMKGHEGSVRSVAFSEDGSFIISGSGDRTLRLWDATTGRAIGVPLSGHQGPVLAVGSGEGGTRIVSASAGEPVRSWPARSAWTAELCARVGRNMSRQEWREAVPANIPYVCQCPGLPIPADNRGTAVPAELCPPAG
jgi:WD40 repeat protein